MIKLAQVVVEDPASDKVQEVELDSDQLDLKKKVEDEIRMKLDQFAKELAQVRKQREEH
ncbi:MAG: hypothetical protein QGG02_02435 [Gammaproteobacteria bacterium]|jgi:hypothetical protein|nr:hypothetical protein [Gammaproteobacteria bacterium]MDP6731190.1 hypothetical protein [Gammaproteobacteria bacterium]|tara:strand:- start:424 stop:600 length:177 start_codon:yes stop_codon:yes gene_type:complete